MLGADGTGTARGADVTTQDPHPVLAYDCTGNGDGTWKGGAGLVDAPARPGTDVAAVTAGRISVSLITPGWNTAAGDHARAALLLTGLRPWTRPSGSCRGYPNFSRKAASSALNRAGFSMFG